MKKKVLSVILLLFMLLGLVSTFSIPVQAEGLFNIKNGVLVRYDGDFGSDFPENVVIPDGVTEIGDHAFFDHDKIKSVFIPDSVVKIDDNAFWGCSGLDSITIPGSVKVIGKDSLGWDRAGSFHTPHDGFIIYGTIGSAAEQYAANTTDADGNRFIKFVPIAAAATADPHPYSTALSEYFKGAAGYKAAYLVDINGDGTKEVIAHKDDLNGGGQSYRLFYFHNGKLCTYDKSYVQGSLFVSPNNYLIDYSHGLYTHYHILSISNGKVIELTHIIADYDDYGKDDENPTYSQDDKIISKSTYDGLITKYGVSDKNLFIPGSISKSNRPNQINEILAMTNTVKAMATVSKVKVNGVLRELESYNIDGNNYFKLRDLAQVVNKTAKNFEVEWDGAKNAIKLISNKVYTPIGGELAKGDGKSKSAQVTTSAIYKDGKEISLTAYNIGGSNFFKLRDIAKAFDIGVTWDGPTNTVGIDTGKRYLAE
ncbi:leucine-rich repeat protein [Tissierella pigra]|uniref:Leucine-rich repeat protein n=1 Tax=Tissierella pigra TaxID=2607614 RepID=A0A6N7XGL9_9FIRM|nr:leucine-rich repeat protein [Tissierella pigra]MBU5424891.1 leucine-rich repeat protein [Tissierella pigra]MSU01169.1 leucine-rich repeat protein [Tissierella pigra]